MGREQKHSDALQKEIEDLRRQVEELKATGAERTQAEEAQRKSPAGAEPPVDGLSTGRLGGEEWYRSLIELGASVYCVVDGDGKILYESPSVQRAYGWRPEELVGRDVFEHVHPDDLESATESFRELLDKPGLTKTVEVRYRHKDSSWRTIEVTGVNLLANPAVAGVVMTSHDVTERKWAEEALKQAKGSFAAFIEDSAFGYVEMDLGGDLTFVNKRVAEMSGYSAEELYKMHFSKLLVPEELQRAEEELKTALTQPNMGPRYHKVRRKDGSLLDIEVNTLPLMKAGKPFGFHLTVEDIGSRPEEGSRAE